VWWVWMKMKNLGLFTAPPGSLISHARQGSSYISGLAQLPHSDFYTVKRRQGTSRLEAYPHLPQA
jgi:hypothetical protein